MLTSERIDLHLPTSWRAATTKELEIIADVMISESRRVTAYHPFDMKEVKVALFFLLSELEVCAPIDPAVAVESQYYLCRRRRHFDPWYKRWWSRLKGRETEPFQVYLYQIREAVEEYLSWLDTPDTIVRFPYPYFKKWGVKFKAPETLMQNFSWSRYRYASDFMGGYTLANNRLLKMMKDKRVSERDLRKQLRMVDNYRAMFLATLFSRKVKKVDDETGLVVNDYAYTSNQAIDNARYFRHFPERKFQVILFWWTGMSYYLQKQYPRCFKKTEVRKGMQNPLETYTRTTSTLEKYLGMTEEQVGRELYTVIFRHLEDMAKEGEEMEKIRNKNK